MLIALGIVGEIATVAGSIAITLNGGVDALLEISKRGYKLDKKVFDEYQNRLKEEQKEKNSGLKKVVGTVLLLTPGVNLLRAGIISLQIKKAMLTDPEIKKALVPMTDSEKEQFAILDKKFDKAAFTLLMLDEEDKKEVKEVAEETQQPSIDNTTESVESVQNRSFVPIETEEIITEEQGPVLKKTFDPKRK